MSDTEQSGPPPIVVTAKPYQARDRADAHMYYAARRFVATTDALLLEAQHSGADPDDDIPEPYLALWESQRELWEAAAHSAEVHAEMDRRAAAHYAAMSPEELRLLQGGGSDE